jgi:heptosyltransferase-1
MQRILIVKTTSMGDVIHALPVLSDLAAAFPGARIDWMVEEPFADLVHLHPALGKTIPVALRTWRKKGVAELWRQWKALRNRLKAEPYDAVIDLQGLLKSALLALAAPGPRMGPGFRHAREPIASLFYTRRSGWDVDSHAVERLRTLSARLLDYPLSGGPRFGILPAPPRQADVDVTVWFFHATARAEKSWPLEHWRELAAGLLSLGCRIQLPWGIDAERRQAEAIAAGLEGVSVLPKMNLGTLAVRLKSVDLVVGVDTGLVHLSGAMELPLVALFFATPQWRYAPKFDPQAISLGDMGELPGVATVFQTARQLLTSRQAGRNQP